MDEPREDNRVTLIAIGLLATPRSAATHLFLILVAAFNLLWFALQLVFSAATRTDDWAWTMHEFHVGEAVRYMMIALGAPACVTAALDPNAISAILHHALPQSLFLSLGLLFVLWRAAGMSKSVEPAAAIAFSVPWIVAAALVGAASILLLGPGVAITI